MINELWRNGHCWMFAKAYGTGAEIMGRTDDKTDVLFQLGVVNCCIHTVTDS